jgi:hypothetical protein
MSQNSDTRTTTVLSTGFSVLLGGSLEAQIICARSPAEACTACWWHVVPAAAAGTSSEEPLLPPNSQTAGLPGVPTLRLLELQASDYRLQ